LYRFFVWRSEGLREGSRLCTLERMKREPSGERGKEDKESGETELRARLEQARLELRALYRALDGLRVAQEVPPELRRLGELDADFAEALWVLKQPKGRFKLGAMRRDMKKSLEAVGGTRQALLKVLPEGTRQRVEAVAVEIRAKLRAEEAYLDIPE
jgi:hypothetical protein